MLQARSRELASQTEQNTLSLQADVRQAIFADDRELLRQELDYPGVILSRSGEGLTDEDVVRLNAFLLVFTRMQENRWLQYQSGAIDERTWRTYRTAIPALFSTEFVRTWFRNRAGRGEFDQGFVEEVEELIAASPIDPTRSLREYFGFDSL